MSDFYGKIIVREDGKVQVVTLLDCGEETTDFCSLAEIRTAIKDAKQTTIKKIRKEKPNDHIKHS